MCHMEPNIHTCKQIPTTVTDCVYMGSYITLRAVLVNVTEMIYNLILFKQHASNSRVAVVVSKHIVT